MKVIAISAAVLLCLCVGSHAKAGQASTRSGAAPAKPVTSAASAPAAPAASAPVSSAAGPPATNTGMPRMPSIYDMIFAKEMELPYNPYNPFSMNHMGMGVGNGAMGAGMGMGVMDPLRYEMMKKHDFPDMPFPPAYPQAYPQTYPQASPQASQQMGRQFVDPYTSMYIADKILDLPTPSM